MGSGRRLSPSWVLAVVGAGAFVAALDQTVVVTVLPSVMLDLKVPITELDRAAWIVTAYLLGYTAAMPLVGRIADVYGYSRVYRASLVVFILGTILVAVAPNLEWMVAARVVQAVGGGATVPIGMAIASAQVPVERQGLALGIVGGAAEAGSMLGPAYGGAIVALFPEWSPGALLGSFLPGGSWRWIFWLNVPQAALIFLALLWLSCEGPPAARVPVSTAGGPRRDDQRRPGSRVDYLGGALLVALLATLSLALSREGLFTLSSAEPFIIGASALLLAGALALYWSPAGARLRAYILAPWRSLWGQRSRRDMEDDHQGVWQPLLAPALFRSAVFLSSNLAQLMVGVSLIIAMVTVPLLANTVMGQPPITGAMWLLRMTAPIPVGAVAGGYLLSTRLPVAGRSVGVRQLMVAGLALTSAGLFLASGWQLDLGEPELTLHLAMTGFGFGLVISPIMVRALGAVGEDYRGTAASLVVVSRMLGMTLGLAALSAWGVEHFQAMTAGWEFPVPHPGESSEAAQARMVEFNDRLIAAGLSLYQSFFRIAATVAAVAVVPALFMREGGE